MLRALAAVFALIAVGCMSVAIVGMVTGRPGDKAGVVIRIAALVPSTETGSLEIRPIVER